MDMHMQRIEKLQNLITERGIDAALITSGENIRYFSGFTSDESALLVAKGKAALFTDFRYLIQAREQMPEEIRLVETSRNNAFAPLKAFVEEYSVASIAFEAEALTVDRFESYRPLTGDWKPLGSEISALRLQKGEDEIASLQRAQDIADRAYEAFLDRVHPGMTELEAAAELNYLGAKFGSEGPSFETIMGSGPNGAMCHAVPGERKLQNGDLVVVDFGCIKDGYHSDTTRTFGIGKLDPELVKIYNIVREAQQRALDALKPGMPGAELDRIARDFIAEKGYGPCFGHSLGHGVGLLIHEAPYASTSSKDLLLPGTTITVEPGIYLEGKGGVRIEDCCVLTEDGFIDLTHLPKELIIL